MEQKFETVIKNLRNNNIDVVCVEKKNDVKKVVEKMLFDGAVISSGGSVTLAECGVIDLIKESRYKYLDRNRPGITEQEKSELYQKVLSSDFYFCSSNAVTENGELLNVDGFCNRISAIAFGPKKVIMIVGKNKIVKNLEEAHLRVKKTAAPLNTKRLCLDTPCNMLGHCISLERCENPGFTDGCSSKNRICRNYLVSALQKEKGRITVILVDDSLGY